MDLTLPDLEQLGIEELHLCAFFGGEDEFLSRWKTDPVELQSSYKTDTGEVGIRLVIEAEGSGDDAHGHLHIDLNNTAEFTGLRELDRVQLRELIDQLANLKGHTVFASIAADFILGIDELPRHGMIRTILGVSTESCGSQLSLTGSEMSIDGDLFRRLTWTLIEDDDLIDAKLYANTETEIGDDYVNSAARLMRQGVECFVLESEERPVKYAKQNISSRESKKSQA